MGKKPLIVISLCVMMLLLLMPSTSALAQTHFSISRVIPSNSILLAEDYQVYIGAGSIRKYEQKIGLGYHMTVMNIGDTNITGSMNNKESTLFGKIIYNWSDPFSLKPGIGTSVGSAFIDFHPITHINLTVVVENMTYSKSGYGIGPFVLLVG